MSVQSRYICVHIFCYAIMLIMIFKLAAKKSTPKTPKYHIIIKKKFTSFVCHHVGNFLIYNFMLFSLSFHMQTRTSETKVDVPKVENLFLLCCCKFFPIFHVLWVVLMILYWESRFVDFGFGRWGFSVFCDVLNGRSLKYIYVNGIKVLFDV